MENTQQPVPIVNTPEPVAPTTPLPTTPVSTQPVVDTTPAKKFDPKAVFAKIRTPKIPKKILIVGGVVIVLLLVLSVAAKTLTNRNRSEEVPTPTENATPTASPVSDIPSQYADDPDVFTIKTDIKKLDEDLDAASFRDDTLRSPTLDWAVKFD